MSWTTEMMVRDRIATLHAEADRRRTLHAIPRRQPGTGPGHGIVRWWDRLMGLTLTRAGTPGVPASIGHPHTG